MEADGQSLHVEPEGYRGISIEANRGAMSKSSSSRDKYGRLNPKRARFRGDGRGTQGRFLYEERDGERRERKRRRRSCSQGRRAAALSQRAVPSRGVPNKRRPHAGWTELHSSPLCSVLFTTNLAAMMSQSLRASVSCSCCCCLMLNMSIAIELRC